MGIALTDQEETSKQPVNVVINNDMTGVEEKLSMIYEQQTLFTRQFNVVMFCMVFIVLSIISYAIGYIAAALFSSN